LDDVDSGVSIVKSFGYLKLNPYSSLVYVFQSEVSIESSGVGVGIFVTTSLIVGNKKYPAITITTIPPTINYFRINIS